MSEVLLDVVVPAVYTIRMTAIGSLQYYRPFSKTHLTNTLFKFLFLHSRFPFPNDPIQLLTLVCMFLIIDIHQPLLIPLINIQQVQNKLLTNQHPFLKFCRLITQGLKKTLCFNKVQLPPVLIKRPCRGQYKVVATT